MDGNKFPGLAHGLVLVETKHCMKEPTKYEVSTFTIKMRRSDGHDFLFYYDLTFISHLQGAAPSQSSTA